MTSATPPASYMSVAANRPPGCMSPIERGPVGDRPEVVDVERDAVLVGDRQQVEHAVGRAAGGGDAGDPVLERVPGHDRRRPDVAPDQVHHQLAGPLSGGLLGWVLGRDAVQAGRRQADELHDRAHRVGRVLAAAGAGSGTGGVLDLVQLVERDLARPVGADRLVDGDDRGVALAPCRRRDRSSRCRATTPGTSSRPRAIAAPGTVLSQPTRQTRPSNRWPRTTSSIESAITSRLTSDVFMPSVPIVTPSLMAIVLNSIGVPPAARMPVLHELRQPALVDSCRASSRSRSSRRRSSGLARSSSVNPIALSIDAGTGAVRAVRDRRGMALGRVGGRRRVGHRGRSPGMTGRAGAAGSGSRLQRRRRGAADAAQSTQAPVSTAVVPPSAGRIRATISLARQGIADLRVGPRLGEDDAADRAVGEDQRAAAVATLDRGPELQDVPPDLVRPVDVVAGRRIPAGHGRRQDRQRAAIRVPERGPDRAACRIRRREDERVERRDPARGAARRRASGRTGSVPRRADARRVPRRGSRGCPPRRSRGRWSAPRRSGSRSPSRPTTARRSRPRP